MDTSSASDGAGSRRVGGSAGGDGNSGRPECEAGIEEAVSCVNGRKIGHSKGAVYKNTKIENLDERKGRSMSRKTVSMIGNLTRDMMSDVMETSLKKPIHFTMPKIHKSIGAESNVVSRKSIKLLKTATKFF